MDRHFLQHGLRGDIYFILKCNGIPTQNEMLVCFERNASTQSFECIHRCLEDALRNDRYYHL